MFTVSQELLEKEKAEMMSNTAMERKTKTFNFAAYHTLDEVSSHIAHALKLHVN